MKATFALLILMMFVTSAMGQTADWKTQWDETLAAAKKEGKVIISGSADPVMRKEIIPKFTARYGIPVEFLPGSSSQLAPRLRTERAAGIYSIDVFMSNAGTTLTVLYPEKMLDPLKPLLVLPTVTDSAKWKRGKPWFIDREGEYILVLFYTVNSMAFINLDQVPVEEMRSVQDLLNPKWKGKIATEDPTTSGRGGGSGAAAYFYAQMGPDFVKKLYIDQKPAFSRERRQLADWLARGTYPICLGCNAVDLQGLREEGFRLKEIFELSGIKNSLNASPFLLSVANKAPHPNAARVFVNWMADKEALEIYSRDSGAPTLRTDVDESFLNPETIPKPGVSYHDNTDLDWVYNTRREAGDSVLSLLKAAK